MWKQTPEEDKKKLSMRIRGSFYCFCMLSCVQLFETPWTAALPGSFDHDFPGKNTGVGCHCLLSGIEPWSPALSGRFFTTEPPGKPIIVFVNCIYLQLSHSWLSEYSVFLCQLAKNAVGYQKRWSLILLVIYISLRTWIFPRDDIFKNLLMEK